MTKANAAEAALALRDIYNRTDMAALLVPAGGNRYVGNLLLAAIERLEDTPVLSIPIWAFFIELLGVSLYLELRRGSKRPLLVERSKGRTEIFLGGLYIVTERNNLLRRPSVLDSH